MTTNHWDNFIEDHESDETTESGFDTFELDPELKEQLSDYRNAVL